MLPSSIGENPFPQFQQSFYSSTFFGGLNGNDTALHHHHDLLIHHVSATVPAASETVNNMVGLAKPTLNFSQDMNKLNGDHCAPPANIPRKRSVKRDRHSKIVTAQGPRDRRVRLSIDIAHKFFGLQDVLGFDKASKTLDWLLTKSKTAIEEVMQKKHTISNEIANIQSSVSESEAAAENGDSEGKPLENFTKAQAENNHPQKAARESRANARARARERARKKMCTMAEKLSTQNQSLPSSLPIAAKRSDSHIDHVFTNEMAAKEMIQEPLSIHRKTNKPSSVSGLQSNLILSTDAKLEDSCFCYTTQNWDTAASSVTRSTFAAMANITSSSKVLQICGSPWEV